VQAQRRQGFAALAQRLGEQHARSIAWTDALRPGLSDLQFTSQYRVPFQFSPYLRQRIKLGNVGVATQGVTLTDLDGQVYDDLTGSYGVNLFGHDVYKRLHRRGQRAGGRPWARCWAPCTPAWPAMWRSSSACRAWTR
jgi:glutamate-1-semialdehyde 2,1-aminomutase